jgi:hypothetical protein
MLFARAEDGEVRSLVAVGAHAIVRADRRRPADPAERGLDLLLDAKDASDVAKCLRPGWKSEQEIGDILDRREYFRCKRIFYM